MDIITKTIRDWANGKIKLEEANKILKENNSLVYIDPKHNHIENGTGAVADKNIFNISGYALLDSGTGSLDKVEIKNGKLVQNVGDMYCLVIIGDNYYNVENGEELVYGGKVNK